MNIKQFSILLCRFALFIIYFWFGLLKILGQSPASPLVKTLLAKTMPFFPATSFVVLFGLFEVIIGILFFIPKMEKFAISLFGLHMATTLLPLFVLRETWQHTLVPTLEGQYIIKNIALMACALCIWVSLDNRDRKIEKINSEPLTFS